MTADRWKRVEQLFAECVDLPLVLRKRHLAEHCRDDPELRAEVESLLAHADAPSFLEEPALDQLDASSLGASDADTRIGQSIGAFEITELIAEGGMGAVYKGRRADEAFEQIVAIKVVKPGFDRGGLLARFLQERQTLAALDHPHIAHLLDGGETADGQPYLVMEYIDGQPLHSWCAEHKPSVAQCLELFRQICRGVEHAHRNLVVHRDLKPLNILVTAEGQAKLLDFGIAKLIDHTADGSATLSPLQLLTPEYASPEQIRGEAVTTASDIYSLGVIFYELLARSKPYEVATRARFEMEKIVCEQPVAPPSSARPGLSTELDAIVMMCMRKEAERRYGTVSELLDDLARFDSRLPLRAQPDSFGYRASKFLRRNALATSLSALAAILLVVGATTTWVQAERARQRAVTAKRVADFMVDLFLNADPWETGGESISIPALLERGVETARRDLVNEPAILATFLTTIGRVRLNLGDGERAQELFAEAQLLLGEDGQLDPELHGDTLFYLGVALHRAQEYEQAEVILRECLQVRTRQLGLATLPAASAQNTLALSLLRMGEFDETEELLQAALDTRSNLLEANDPEIGITLSNLGALELYRGRLDQARERFADALALQLSAYPQGHPNLATSHNNLGYIERERDDLIAARKHYTLALEMRRRLLGEGHPLIADSLLNLGLLEIDEANYAAAAGHLQESIDILRTRLPDDHMRVQRVRESLDEALAAL